MHWARCKVGSVCPSGGVVRRPPHDRAAPEKVAPAQRSGARPTELARMLGEIEIACGFTAVNRAPSANGQRDGILEPPCEQ
jgi:hypothetical protein